MEGIRNYFLAIVAACMLSVLACALLAAAIFLVWLCMDAQSVAFIYSEF